jgi:hypothetical protein
MTGNDLRNCGQGADLTHGQDNCHGNSSLLSARAVANGSIAVWLHVFPQLLHACILTRLQLQFVICFTISTDNSGRGEPRRANAAAPPGWATKCRRDPQRGVALPGCVVADQDDGFDMRVRDRCRRPLPDEPRAGACMVTDVRRVWLHTCTFDHPSAVAFYQRSGFIPLRRRHL